MQTLAQFTAWSIAALLLWGVAMAAFWVWLPRIARTVGAAIQRSRR